MRALGMSTDEAALAQWSPLVGLSLVPAAGTVLGDGKVLLWSSNARTTFEGGSGHTYTTLFDPATLTATERDVTETAHDMFCPGTSRLPDGRLLVNGGIGAGLASLYDPLTNTWSNAAGMNIARGYNANTVLADGSVMTIGIGRKPRALARNSLRSSCPSSGSMKRDLLSPCAGAGAVEVSVVGAVSEGVRCCAPAVALHSSAIVTTPILQADVLIAWHSA